MYGVIVTVVGLLDSGAQLSKARGVHINLWVGIAMLGFGLMFLAWGLLRPVNLGKTDGSGEPAERGGAAERGWAAERGGPAKPGE